MDADRAAEVAALAASQTGLAGSSNEFVAGGSDQGVIRMRSGMDGAHAAGAAAPAVLPPLPQSPACPPATRFQPTPGGIAGACGVVAGQPLDTVRVRQQAAVPAAAQRAGGSGGLALLRSIAAGEGVRHLFRGLTYPLLTAALQVTVGRCPADCEAYNEHSQPVPFYGLIPLVLPPAYCRTLWCFSPTAPQAACCSSLRGRQERMYSRSSMGSSNQHSSSSQHSSGSSCHCRTSSGPGAPPAWCRR